MSLAIGHDAAGDLDPVQVLFDPVDVSGDSNVELARLTARDGIVEISAAAGADSPLSPLASAARISARKALDHQTRTVHGPVLVALDTSASMLPMFAGGGVAAAVDIVVGVAAALGINDVSAVLIGEDAVEVSCDVAAQLAAEVRHAVPRWSAGARWSRLPDAGGRIIICTDFPTRNALQRFAVMTFSDDTQHGFTLRADAAATARFAERRRAARGLVRAGPDRVLVGSGAAMSKCPTVLLGADRRRLRLVGSAVRRRRAVPRSGGLRIRRGRDGVGPDLQRDPADGVTAARFCRQPTPRPRWRHRW